MDTDPLKKNAPAADATGAKPARASQEELFITADEAWAALTVQTLVREARLKLAAQLERQARDLRRGL